MLLAGGAAGTREGVLEIALWRRRAPPPRFVPFEAITFGHVVLGRSRAALMHLRAHEHAHVAQYERWGAVFLLAYPLASLTQWLRGRRAYLDNPFEVQAREEALSRRRAVCTDRSAA